jgi:hypothetical protein
MMVSFLRQLWSGWLKLTARFGDFQARWILTVFYFTIALPFGLLARLALDSLRIRQAPQNSGWIERERPADNDIAAAQREF